MEVLINIIILYIIFSLISSFVFKRKKLRRFLPATMQQEPPSPESQEEMDEPPGEIIPELLDNNVEFVSESLPEAPRVEPYRPEPRRMSGLPSKTPKIRRAHSFLLPSGQDYSYLQGIILSEILGPPVSKKKRKRS